MATDVLPLDSSDLSLDRGGGKAANLATLSRAGLPVPSGFVITTDAYRAVAEESLVHEIALALADASADQPDSLDTASARIRAAFERADIPIDLADAIRAAYRALAPDSPAVAVRSSATAEDLPTASFAGQQETLLNVRGEESLLSAVRRCWASLWSPRAIAYRARLGIARETVALAVVVQRMVEAEASGILFTANPTTGGADEVVIEAAWGLGEAVVGGRTSPDSFVVDKASGDILSASVGEKATMTRPTEGGTAEAEVPPDLRARLCLSPDQVARLAGLAREVETLIGAPQDVEWAVVGGDAYLLQARPITTVATPVDDDWPPPFPPDAAQPFDLWTQADVGERWPDPVTPLTWSTWESITDENMRYSVRGPRPVQGMELVERIKWSRRAFGRVYMNEGALAHVYSELFGIPMSAGKDASGSGLDKSGAAFRPSRFLRTLPTFLALLGMRLRNEQVYVDFFDRVDRWVREFQARDLSVRLDADLWEELESTWLPRLSEGLSLHADATSSAIVALPMLEALCGRWLGRRELAAELLAGMAGVVAAEMPAALWRIAREIERAGLAEIVRELEPADALRRLRGEPTASECVALLDQFLERHGHRCAVEAEWANPRWAEAPALVLGAIRGYLGTATPDPAGDVARQRGLRTARLADAGRRLGPLRWAPFKLVLARTEHLVRLRDNGQHYVVRLALPMRRIFWALGERWAERGWLPSPDDVFYLAAPEVARIARDGAPAADGLQAGARAAARRRARERWMGASAPETLGADGRPIASADGADTGSILQGIAASAGRATGPARIILDPAELGSLHRGDVLVTRATDPGWTPAFPLVAAMVVEIGGQLSHAAIVAREYGLPAVVGVPGATRRIREGQTIAVDGTAGRVVLRAAEESLDKR